MAPVQDPERAAASVAELAALSDAEQAAEVYAAAAAVVEAVDAWIASPSWRRDTTTDYCREMTTAAAEALDAVDDREDLAAVCAAAGPMLKPWWPSWPAPALAAVAVEAVARLRYLTQIRPGLVVSCRRLVAQPEIAAAVAERLARPAR